MSEIAFLIAKYCILSEIFFFNVVGLFGNIQLLWTTYRKKSTHTKPGLLLAMNAFFHILCLLGELVNACFIIFGHHPARTHCYVYIAFYIFSICQQVFITLLMAIDLLVALLFPIWYVHLNSLSPTNLSLRYRKCNATPYLLIFILIGTTYSLTFTVWGFIVRDDEALPFCNPPLGLKDHVSFAWSMSNIVINSLVVLAYAIIIITVKFNAKPSACHETRRVVKRLQVSVIVFIFSWYMAILGVNLGYALRLSEDALAIWHSNMVIFALLCYSQTFYVCLWRSAEYRTAFLEQLSIMTGRTIDYQRKSTVSSSSNSKVFVQPFSKSPR